ncbi:MAG: carbohydrate binding domain-containing protein [Candidatus Wallbacteria bacterium]|nr:carbohydrate binding domain-containing protein [Candidatus Wallbacteria bacterium]
MKPLTSIKSCLRNLSELVRQISSMRRKCDDSIFGILVPSDHSTLYHVNTGPDSSLTIESTVADFLPENMDWIFNGFLGPDTAAPLFLPALRLTIRVESRNFDRNWVELIRNSYPQPVRMSGNSSFGFFLRSSGEGGFFRLVITDKSGNEAAAEVSRPLSGNRWHFVTVSKTDFRPRPWCRRVSNFDFSSVTGFRIGFSLPAEAVTPLETVVNFAPGCPVRGSWFNLLKELPEIHEGNLGRFFWYGAGPDSSLTIQPGLLTDGESYGAVRLRYSINSRDSGKNWIVLRRQDYTTPVKFIENGVLLWLKSDGQGGEIRLDLEDTEGKVFSHTFSEVLRSACWHCLRIPFQSFSPPAPKNMKSFQIYIGLDWQSPPAEGEVILSDFSRQTPYIRSAPLREKLPSFLRCFRDFLYEFQAWHSKRYKYFPFTDDQPGRGEDHNFFHSRHGMDAEASFTYLPSCPGEDETGFLRRKLLSSFIQFNRFYPAFSLKFTVRSRDWAANWCELTHDFPESPAEFSGNTRMALLIRAHSPGGILRLIITDRSGGEWFASHAWSLCDGHWHIMFLRPDDFRPFKWGKKPDSERPGKIVSYRFAYSSSRHCPLPHTAIISVIPLSASSARLYSLMSELSEVNSATMLDFFWFGVEGKGELSAVPGQSSADSVSGGLGLNWKALDNSPVAFLLRRLPMTPPLDLSSYSGVDFWIKSTGPPGDITVTLEDGQGRQITWKDRDSLGKSHWHHSVLHFASLKQRCNNVREFSIVLEPNPGNRVNGTALFHHMRTQALSSPIRSSELFYNLFDDLRSDSLESLGELFWWGAGIDSAMDLHPSAVDSQGIAHSLRLDYTIRSEDCEKNWIVLRHHDFSPPMNLGHLEGTSIWVKGDGQGGHLRFKLRDSSGREIFFADKRSLADVKWKHLKIPFQSFTEPTDGQFDVTAVSGFEIYLGLDWKKPPVSGTVFFNDFRKHSTTDASPAGKDFQAFHSGIVRDRFQSASHRFVEDALSRGRLVTFADKILPYTEYQSLLALKYSGKIPSASFVQFSEKDLIIMESKKRNIWGLDKVALFVEPTNLCNLQCIMCNHGDHSFQRPLGVMKYGEFKKIIDEICSMKLNLWEFAPYWLGESFVHPQIIDFLRLSSEAASRPGSFRHFNIHTNGVMLEERHLSAILESRLSSILFSVDACHRETYDKIRIGGDFDRLVRNIRWLIAERRRRCQRHPSIIVQMIVMDENAGEISEFCDFWRNEGLEKLIYAGRSEDNPFFSEAGRQMLFPQVVEDSVFVKALEPNALTKHQTHREIGQVLDPGRRRPCGSLWRMMSVAWDGTATACCRDDQQKMPIGNVLSTSLSDVWYGEPLRRQRLGQITGDFSATPKCVDCVNWVKYPLSEVEIADYLHSIGEDHLLDSYRKRMHGHGS